jgi:general stress protein YciG
MDPTQQRQIASKGGRVAHERGSAHEFNSTEAAEAGRKGGQAVSQNRAHMAEIGRRGGKAAHHRNGNGSASPPPHEGNGEATT